MYYVVGSIPCGHSHMGGERSSWKFVSEVSVLLGDCCRVNQRPCQEHPPPPPPALPSLPAVGHVWLFVQRSEGAGEAACPREATESASWASVAVELGRSGYRDRRGPYWKTTLQLTFPGLSFYSGVLVVLDKTRKG